MNTRGWLMMGLGLILTAVGLAVALIRPMAPLKAVPMPQKDEFAQDRAPPKVTQPPFDAARAMKHLEDICAIGTRVSGSFARTTTPGPAPTRKPTAVKKSNPSSAPTTAALARPSSWKWPAT